MDEKELNQITAAFLKTLNAVQVSRLDRGHIHDTYIVTVAGFQTQFILQKINHGIFGDVNLLMNNISKALQAVRSSPVALNYGLIVPEIVPAPDGELYQQDSTGNYWRMYSAVPATESFDICTNIKQAREAGKICAVFEAALFSLNPSEMQAVILDFHNLPARYTALEDAVGKDLFGRVAECSGLIEAVLELRKDAAVIHDALERGEIPYRVTHNDLKFNNVLFDLSGRAVSVVDYDTCMPGSIVYDYGNLITFTCISGREDEEDLSKIQFRADIFESINEGFMPVLKEFLTSEEKALFRKAPALFALNESVRFLTDYLKGDVYFKIKYPQQNLLRARARLHAARLLEQIPA
ncbi:MAG: aminoglycoside phosphotransferase family protein [Candidatus Dadabacteria bacterium]|nr:MAG: aminoglycoside phosphotransferase family protein [Candidatus Dadabacteria bacterium]